MATRSPFRESASSVVTGPAISRLSAAVVRTAILAIWMALPAALSPGLFGVDKEQAPEYQVKAAFLLNFTKFIEWPASESAPEAPFSICIMGDDPFGPALDRT